MVMDFIEIICSYYVNKVKDAFFLIVNLHYYITEQHLTFLGE